MMMMMMMIRRGSFRRRRRHTAHMSTLHDTTNGFIMREAKKKNGHEDAHASYNTTTTP